MKNKKQSIGQRIKELREMKGWTQSQLGEHLFVSDKTISKWEKDKSEPESDSLVKIAELFNVSLDYLLKGSEPEKDKKIISQMELACREDNIALLDGVDCEAFDENGKNLDYYAKKYDAKNVKTFLLNSKIDKYVQENKISKTFHVAALPKDSSSEDDLVLIGWNGSYNKTASFCAQFEKKGYHGFKVFREIGVNEKVEFDYQYFFCQCLDDYGFNKMQFLLTILDDFKSGVLELRVYRDKTYKLNKRDKDGKLVPDYYPDSAVELDAYAYVRPAVMKSFLDTLAQLNVADWENRSWGCSVHDLFFVLKEQQKGNALNCHKFYIAPGKDSYKKFIKEIQKVCFESLKPHQYRKFTNLFDVDYMPYYRATLPLIETIQVFKDMDLEQKEIKEGQFDVSERFAANKEE